MVTSMFDFAIDPVAFSRVDQLVIELAKYFSLTENDLDDSDSHARQEIETTMHNEHTQVFDFTSIINYERLHAVIKKAAEINDLNYADFEFSSNPNALYVNYKGEPLDFTKTP